MKKTIIAIVIFVVAVGLGWFLLPKGSGKVPYSQQSYTPAPRAAPPEAANPAPLPAPEPASDPAMTPMP